MGPQARALGADTGATLAGLRPSGNRAFDEYRDEALRRLEEEANEFRGFLERLRMAKDRAEFDDFMRERRNRQASGSTPGSDAQTADLRLTLRKTCSRPHRGAGFFFCAWVY